MKGYFVEWLDKQKEWKFIGSLEGEELRPGRDGFLEHFDELFSSTPPGGTYHVVACFGEMFDDNTNVSSKPLTLTPRRPAVMSRKALAARLKRRATPAPARKLILSLKYTPRGWTTLLPAAAATCLGKRLVLEVRADQLTDATLALLETILTRLPKFAARAEQAFEDEGGVDQLDESDQLARPQIVIGLRDEPPGGWTLVIGVKGSDYAWHLEFVRTRFKRIWAGD